MKKLFILFTIPALIAAGIFGALNKYLNMFKETNFLIRKRNKNMTFSDIIRLIMQDYKNFKVVDENKVQLWKAKTIYGVTFHFYIIPKRSRFITDDVAAPCFTRLRYFFGEPVKVFVREEIFDCRDEVREFLLNHEMGHILIPSKFGRDQFQISSQVLGQHNHALAITVAYNYVSKYNLNIYNNLINPIIYKWDYDTSFTSIDKDYIEIAANIYATLTTKDSENVIKDCINDINPHVTGNGFVERTLNKSLTKTILKKLLKIAQQNEPVDENYREVEIV